MRQQEKYALLFLVVIFVSALAQEESAPSRKTVHTVFTAECDTYFNWQSIGLFHSFKLSGQPGPITRIVSCTDEQRQRYQDIDVGVPTHFAPSWTIHPRTGDTYSGINKPVAVRDWLQTVKPVEDIILIIDDDTIMRRTLDPEELGVKAGWAVAGFYGYMKGVNNAMAEKHVPNVIPRNDSIAGPMNRRGDQVGGFSIMYKDDLARMADDWVKVTEDVRADPDAWETSGDVYTPNPGDKPWIAEMYGYSFGASKHDIWHLTNDKIMLYPGYTPVEVSERLPNVLHYGIKFYVNHSQGTWSFDKHWFRQFDPLKCPPWEHRDELGRPMSGLFDSPPHPKDLLSSGVAKFRDLLSMETVATINEALCERHVAHCEPAPSMMEACKKVMDLSNAIREAQREEVLHLGCRDEKKECKMWAERGECKKNPEFMTRQCAQSCGGCEPVEDSDNIRGGGTKLSTAAQKQEGGHVVVSTNGQHVQKASESLVRAVQNQGEGKKDPGRIADAKHSGMNPDEKKELMSDHELANPDEKKATPDQSTHTPQAVEQQDDDVKDKAKDIPEEVAKSEKDGKEILPKTVGGDGIADQDPSCSDADAACPEWATRGECKKNPAFMLRQCQKSCSVCTDSLGGGDQSEHAKKLKRLNRKEYLKRRCYRGAHWSMEEVSTCLKLADKEEEYPGPVDRLKKKIFPKLAVESKRIKTPKLDAEAVQPQYKTARRLKEKVVGNQEREDLEVDRRSLVILGGLVVVLLVLVRTCLPRSTSRLKRARQD